MTVRLRKYSALGNVYLVAMDTTLGDRFDAKAVRALCAADESSACDGVLVPRIKGDGWGVTIWNSDGTTAEKSGNGLRILARALWDDRVVDARPFRIATEGGDVIAEVLEEGRFVRVQMGRVEFLGADPIRLLPNFQGYLVSVGNPHCVCFVDHPSETLAREWGPPIEQLPIFPNRTNVQFVLVESRDNIRLAVWERGSGYTRSSGTSAIAASAVCHRLKLVDSQVQAIMPGGTLAVTLSQEWMATIEGEVGRMEDVVFPDAILG